MNLGLTYTYALTALLCFSLAPVEAQANELKDGSGAPYRGRPQTYKASSGQHSFFVETTEELAPAGGDSLVQTTCDQSKSLVTIAAYQEDSKEYACKTPSLLSEELARFMEYNLLKCVESALGGLPSNIEVHSLGTVSDRVINTGKGGCEGQPTSNGGAGGCPKSQHSTGRAIDIAGLNISTGSGTKYYPLSCKDKNGKLQPGFNSDCVSDGSSPEGRFFDHFKLCWANAVRDYNSNESLGVCSTSGVITCEDNEKHHDHIHVSLPFCPGKPGIAGK